MLRAEESEAMELFPRLGILAKLSNSLSNSSLGHISQHFAVRTEKVEDAATIPQRRSENKFEARPGQAHLFYPNDYYACINHDQPMYMDMDV
jgi:hypothetical protein